MTFAEAPENVTVKPPFVSAETVAPPAKPVMALIAFWTFAASYVTPPEPITEERPAPPVNRRRKLLSAGLKPVSVTTWTSLPPCRAFWMPCAVLFCPRTIGVVWLPL